MENITVSEKYALCMIKEGKNINSQEIAPYLVVSMIVEMVLDGVLEINENNRVKLLDKQPSKEWHIKLYSIIEEQTKKQKKEFIPVEDIIVATSFGFTTAKQDMVVRELKAEMMKKELISEQEKKVLFFKSKKIVANEEVFKSVINEVRDKFLNDGDLSNDIVLLASLLNSTSFLKSIFIKFEKKDLKKRLEEIKDNNIAETVKIAQRVIDAITVAVAIIASHV